MSYPTTVKSLYKAVILSAIFLISAESLFSQLVFKNPTHVAGTDLRAGAVYRFSNVASNIDALVKIDSLVNGARVQDIDESGGVGYDDAFQPKIQSGGNGRSYAVFTVSFVLSKSNLPTILLSLTATNLDLDGNNNLKEFCEFNMGGGLATFMSNSPQINVFGFGGKFLAENKSGVEYTGIDTSADAVMFKVQKNLMSKFEVRLGANVRNNSQGSRQYSVYMKDFQITNASTLPVSLLNFQTTLKDKNAALSWTTTNHFNFSHFVVEKSTDARNFKEAAIVFAEQTSTIVNDFKFKDDLKNSTANTVYYRLKMVDIDGVFSYSETRMVRLTNEENKVQISTFPNPVTNEVRVVIPTSWQDKQVTYEIYSNTGILVQRFQNKSAAQVQQLQVQQLQTGNYILKVNNGLISTTTKFIKH